MRGRWKIKGDLLDGIREDVGRKRGQEAVVKGTGKKKVPLLSGAS